jgi:hypothetical protein
VIRRALRPSFGALEKHVLNPVRDAGDAYVFIAAAHPVPDPEADDRSRLRLLDQDLEAVA